LVQRHSRYCAKGDTMPSSDTESHVLHKNPIAALTVPSHAASYSNRMFETNPYRRISSRGNKQKV